MKVRLTQIDGKLPNIALMKLAHWHRANGDGVVFSKRIYRDMLEPEYGRVYGSAIFSRSAALVSAFRQEFPGAIVGGTHDMGNLSTVEDIIGVQEYENLDYSIYPAFSGSIGFTQRGCRLKCGFCVVPRKEGKNRSVNSIAAIWRGDPHPRHLHLLDNDFFGQQGWQEKIAAIIDGKFKVCFNQGINVRLINDESAAALAAIPYYDDQFKTRRLYTAWDNLKDEKVFSRGVDMLERAGVRPSHLMAYMLVGWDAAETWERLLYRFNRMVERGIRPYPMVYGDRDRTLPLGGHNASISSRTLGEFQRWVIRRSYKFIPFAEYDVNERGHLATGQAEMAL